MSFINGLKHFFKKPIYLIIIILFIISWFLILIGLSFIPASGYIRFIYIFIGILASFTFVLFIISFFKPIEKLNYVIILILFLISLPVILIFKDFLRQFYFFCLIANQVLTAFFAFKICLDSSTQVDDFLYKNKKSRSFTRVIEFAFFGFIASLLYIFTWQTLQRLTPGIAQNGAIFFRIIFLVNIILIIIVITRFVITKKLAAYITLFFILTFLYILYIVIDIIAEVIFPDPSNYAWYYFLLDLFLFIYIIGSIFDKVEYIEKKLKVIRAETISFFVILMKLIAQFTKIFPNIPGLVIQPQSVIDQQLYLMIILVIVFLGCTLFFGIHSILGHKEGENKTEYNENSSEK